MDTETWKRLVDAYEKQDIKLVPCLVEKDCGLPLAQKQRVNSIMYKVSLNDTVSRLRKQGAIIDPVFVKKLSDWLIVNCNDICDCGIDRHMLITKHKH
jgi:hypothetical protein